MQPPPSPSKDHDGGAPDGGVTDRDAKPLVPWIKLKPQQPPPDGQSDDR